MITYSSLIFPSTLSLSLSPLKILFSRLSNLNCTTPAVIFALKICSMGIFQTFNENFVYYTFVSIFVFLPETLFPVSPVFFISLFSPFLSKGKPHTDCTSTFSQVYKLLFKFHDNSNQNLPLFLKKRRNIKWLFFFFEI
uniref:Uncharacterized protein n=1 Tax=Cacopsylla melanoneura TaxID=428564 RepID=A0A8D8VX27_9HEMI